MTAATTPISSSSSSQEGVIVIVASSLGTLYNSFFFTVFSFPNHLGHHFQEQTFSYHAFENSIASLFVMPLTLFKPFIEMHLSQIIQPQQVHQMTISSMNNIFKTKQLNFMTKNPLLETIKPTSVH